MLGGSLLFQRSVGSDSCGKEILDKQLMQPYKTLLKTHHRFGKCTKE
jgi:hypothetical protein